ncbi:MAG TPA: DUF4386 domain-containing protein [Steroidobacteraceae bacterium]|jgi:hypothetical protein
MPTPAKGVGRIIGVLVLMQMIGSGVVNFVLLEPAFAPPGFLVNAAGHSLEFGLSAFLGVAVGMLSLGIAIAAFQVFREYSHPMALWFVALSVVGCSLIAVENINVMSLLSLSQAYAKANAADRGLFEALRTVVASARNWTHYIALIVAGCTLFVFYGVLFRFALVPRALAAVGLAAVLLQIAAVAMPLFGHAIVFPMIMPLGLVQLVLALWLIAKGLPASNKVT